MALFPAVSRLFIVSKEESTDHLFIYSQWATKGFNLVGQNCCFFGAVLKKLELGFTKFP